MADAESNLVPSEAADQVEVALEAQAAADDGILYLNEYQYETTSSPTLRAWSPRPGAVAPCTSPPRLPRSSASACWWPAAAGSSSASC